MIPPREFLKKIQPFSFLSEGELDIILSALEVHFFETNAKVYGKGTIAEHVYVIFSGRIGLFDDETAVDYLSRGEIFGVVCLHGRPSPFTAKAMEDSVCYSIAMSSFTVASDKNKRFSAFFTTFINRRFQMFRTIASDSKLLEEAAFVVEVKRIVYKEPVSCRSHTSIANAVSEMEQQEVSSIVVIDDNKKPVGILTRSDLVKVVTRGKKSDSIVSFMSAPVKTVDTDTTIFDALTKMIDSGIDHLVVVTKEKKVFGVITRKDIQVHLEPSLSVVKLFRKVVKAATIRELETISRTLRVSVAKIAMTGASFYDLTRMICSVHDAIVAKVIEIVALGRLADPYVWVHMGSSGRKEEIIATDQDNALVCKGSEPVAFAGDVTASLARIGFPKCPGNYMASSDRWNQGLSVWKEYFRQWFQGALPDHIRNLSVFLDMRPVYGDKGLYSELVAAIKPVVTDGAVNFLAYDAVQLEPPLGIPGIVRLHKGLDLKTYGIYPIVNGARVLAIDSGLFEITNTKERLEALNADGVITSEMCNDVLESYGFLQDLRLRHHSRAVLSQTDTNNTISTKELAKVDLLLLKESLKIVASLQKFLMKKYNVQRTVIYSQL
jgi:CBS domain-containing protein